MTSCTLRERAYHALIDTDPARKITAATALYQQAQTLPDAALREPPSQPIERLPDPGRPAKPILRAPRELTRRSPASQAGRNAMAHAFAHIEFNAINIGLDAVYRFDDQPADFYRDWLRVAAEEGKHFQLLNDYLQQHGQSYGDHPAHDSLWETVHATDHDVLVRMALIPRVLEARGLDVTPGIAEKLRQHGDTALADILGIIYTEEIGHVEIGTRWFRHHCALRGLDARDTFRALLNKYMAGRIRGPYDEPGRLQAGFSPEEIEDLKALEAHTLALLDSEPRRRNPSPD
ncbi:ferritin-like domain-containing protein [Halothiobacillus sp. DCM-1]|uniref:ferritin-like domain-containing protein n=1 Tax=Halothiobacillus sp. DCM-1 TaxID=3112558 RepID=UPI0032555420